MPSAEAKAYAQPVEDAYAAYIARKRIAEETTRKQAVRLTGTVKEPERGQWIGNLMEWFTPSRDKNPFHNIIASTLGIAVWWVFLMVMMILSLFSGDSIF